MWDKKQIQAFFSLRFKMGHEAAETAHINSAFGPETANERTVRWWYKKFCKGDESLEDEEHSGRHGKETTANWEPSSKLIFWQLHKEVPKNSTSTILQSFSIWSKLESCKSLTSGCFENYPKIKNINVLKRHLLSFYTTTMNHFSIRLWQATKSGFYTTTSNDQLSGWTKKKLQSTS